MPNFTQSPAEVQSVADASMGLKRVFGNGTFTAETLVLQPGFRIIDGERGKLRPILRTALTRAEGTLAQARADLVVAHAEHGAALRTTQRKCRSIIGYS